MVMKRIVFALLICSFTPWWGLAQNGPVKIEEVQLSGGQTFVFLGNSITHQCLYTQYVEDYYFTRYPDRRINFVNAGISGDEAIDALNRFDSDVAQHKPDYVSILLGMNDGHYESFDHEIFNTYKQDMYKLLDRIKAIGARPVLLTPTMFDGLAAYIDKSDDLYEAEVNHYNATLAYFGAWLYQVAGENGYAYANLYTPLNEITREERKRNPKFTLIEDSIHPEEDGQMIMASSMLKGINAESSVSFIHIEAEDDDWRLFDLENGNLNKIEGGGIEFSFEANSLPWVVPPEASLGYKLAGAGSELSRETIRISGLPPGQYALSIDDKLVGTYSHIDWGEGIELQANGNTPQYKQAMEVALLNQKRNEEIVMPMRDLLAKIALAKHFALYPDDVDKEDAKELGLHKASLDEILRLSEKELKTLAEKNDLMVDQIYTINKPVAHTYLIRKAG